MDRIDVMRLFVRVADSGSFSKAAGALSIGQPTVSKLIAALETRLGAQLFRRTSRGLSLTDAGQDYYESSVQLLENFEIAESRIGKAQLAPSGVVRVALSAAIGRMYLVPRLPAFFAHYPEVKIDLNVSERHINLVEEGIDIAIRVGNLNDSTLVSRRIGTATFATVASRAYLEKYGVPEKPSDLEHHQCLTYLFNGAPRPWLFNDSAGTFPFVPKGPVRTNDFENIRAAVLSGLGIAHNGSLFFQQEVKSGEIVQLLKDFAPAPLPIHVVWAGSRRLPSKVRVLIEFLAEVFADIEAPK
ncbi:MAG TPA: LysR family transcriptional regulator [Oxalicibacterium sp.]|jgi:LysR family transcriptional regulator for bpeEF and oprC|nr:LysR family transcriptional regulator [Oxalicibacterium sp.]